MGYDLETLRLRAWADLSVGLRPETLATFRASMHQRLPWEAAVPLEQLGAASFPKLVVAGGWETASTTTRAAAGAALQAVCDSVAGRIGAEHAVIPGAFHSPHRAQPAAFNARLGAFLDAASDPERGASSPTRPGPSDSIRSRPAR